MKFNFLAIFLFLPFGVTAAPAESSSKYYRDWINSNALILIDTSAKKVLVKNENNVIEFPAAVGKASTLTPNGNYVIQQKTKNPWWKPTPDIRAEYQKRGKPLPLSVKPGPGNPLGPYLIRFNGAYAMHGTNDPKSIGKAVSHGCVRLKNNDISEIFSLVEVGDGLWIRGSSNKNKKNVYTAKKQETEKVEEAIVNNMIFASEIKKSKEEGRLF